MVSKRKAAIGYALVLCVGAVLAVGVHFNARKEYALAKEHFIDHSHAEALAAARQVDVAMKSIYENLRTISYLPGVRNVDRHGGNLSGEARETIRHIYNNLAANVAVSEVYIVPVDLDPDKLDPVTGKPETPILMFDKFIAHPQSRTPNAAGKLAELRGAIVEDAPEEIEIFEYRRMREQFAWLKAHYPDNKGFADLDTPVIGAPEVITCDNTQFRGTGLDADRTGVIFSAPFFGPDDRLKGSVSAIILNSALRAMLPAHNFSLVNTGYDYFSQPSMDGQERASAAFAARGQPDPTLIYSEVLPLAFNDPHSPWKLWVGYPDSAFIYGAELHAIGSTLLSGYFIVILSTFAGLIGWTLLLRSLALVVANAAANSLEDRVAERTAKIHYLATHDTLTGLPNRVMLSEALETALARTRRGGIVAVHMLDLDNFKAVNDTLGHPVGDKLLKLVAERLAGQLRECDTVARMGGDEFVILESDVAKPSDGVALAERLIEVVSHPYEIDGHQVNVGTSIGIAVGPQDGISPEDLLRNADLALYRAKSDGRGTFRFFEPDMDAQMRARGEMERDLRKALADNELELHYQPIYNLEANELNGFEALLRWHHPEKGLISPNDFIPLAEETRLIVPIGEWVIRQACATIAKLPGEHGIAVNLSVAQFRSPSLVDIVETR